MKDVCSDLCRVAVRRSPRGKAEAPGDQVKEEEEIQERAEDAGSLPLEVKKEDETVTAFRKQTRMFLPLDENQTPPQSVRVSPRSKLKPFNPNCSYGLEFTVRTKAFYCNLCSVFYMRESVEEDLHCCSKLHYDKLREYYQKRAQLRKCSRKLT
ncbi:Matrin-3 [Oryzias melastigma]|uniref:Matrin-3 n=1 Tax=Oryzias melastigma TaxID=30732 RepID=A0A834FJF1_ORYME|nr:Matrin-3 [Oryzias melastigma]